MVSETELFPWFQLTVTWRRMTAGCDGLGGCPLEHRSDWPWLFTDWVVKFAVTANAVPASVDLGICVVVAEIQVAGFWGWLVMMAPLVVGRDELDSTSSHESASCSPACRWRASAALEIAEVSR